MITYYWIVEEFLLTLSASMYPNMENNFIFPDVNIV